MTTVPFWFFTCALWIAAPPGSGGPYQATGLKVGEVTDSSAIVWTRLTRDRERNPADGPMFEIAVVETPEREGAPRKKEVVGVRFPEGATMADVRDAAPGAAGVVRVLYRKPGDARWRSSGWRFVDPARDFTRQFRLDGLAPDTRYRVRVEGAPPNRDELGSVLEGEFRTAPASEDNAPVTFTVITGQAYPDRDGPHGFDIYPAMLDLDPSFFVHTGDIVYYDALAKTVALARYHWQRTYGLPTNVEFHRNVASYFLKDDHDVWMNDCWPSQKSEFMYRFTFAEGQAIFREQVPMGDRTYRSRRWGRDLQVWFVEGRDFRSPNTDPDGPEKTIWGAEQKEWFKRTVAESDATFRILVSPTPLVGPDREKKNDNHSNAGFFHEGNELRRFIASQRDLYVVCGDRHWQYASVDPDTGVREYSSGPASNAHAGGWKQDDFRPAVHRYLNVTGGFFSLSVDRLVGEPRLRARFHDTAGHVLFEDVRFAGHEPPRVEVVAGAGAAGALRSASGVPLNRPFGLDFDSYGNLYIAELEGGRIHRLDTSGRLTTVAGDGSRGYAGDGGPAAGATFNGMHNIAATPEGDLYISDAWNHVVRRIDARSGIVSTFAGTGEAGFSGDGGPAAKASLHQPICVTLSPANDQLYIADLDNRRIRVIDLESGNIQTIAGNGEKGIPLDEADATESPLVDPRAVACDSKGNVYVLERGGHALRLVTPMGKIRTVVNASGERGDDDGPAKEARLASPKHVAVDSEDCVLIADEGNALVRRYDPRTETVTTILGRGDGVTLANPHGVCFDAGRIYVVDSGNHRILRLFAR